MRWLDLVEPTGTRHLWRLTDVPDEELTDAIGAIKAHHAVPDEWLGTGWSVVLVDGDPHPDVVEVATAHEYSDLP